MVRNMANPSKSLPNTKNSNMPTGVPSSTLMSSTPAMAIPKIKHSEKASEAEKMLESLDDMKKIVEINKFSILIATHSPQIINDNWDLVEILGELE